MIFEKGKDGIPGSQGSTGKKVRAGAQTGCHPPSLGEAAGGMGERLAPQPCRHSQEEAGCTGLVRDTQNSSPGGFSKSHNGRSEGGSLGGPGGGLGFVVAVLGLRWQHGIQEGNPGRDTQKGLDQSPMCGGAGHRAVI